MKKYNLIEIPHKNYSEFFITLNHVAANLQTMNKISEEIHKKKINVIHITFSGNIKSMKDSYGSLKAFPIISIGESQKGKGGNNNGIFIYALRGKGIKKEYIHHNNEIIGTHFWLPDGSEGLFLKTPANLPNKSFGGFEKEAREAYKTIEKNITKYKFSFKDIYRFWNYMEDIDGNYASFNKARDYCFKKYGIIDYPAATGIEATLPNDQNISISMEALKTKDKKQITINIIKSDLQCDAFAYGPKFSRAKLIIFKKDKVQKLFISGTSSVDPKGDSILTENYEKNVNYVMSCVDHLLKKANMSSENIVMSRIYSKNSAIEKTFEKLYSKIKWNFPYNKTITNICRDSFIFEIECIAARKIS